MARLLIIGGGERGRALARARIAAGDVARIVAAADDVAAIESAGAEPWVGDPCRLATVVGALDGVAVVCWLFGDARQAEGEARALNGSLLETFLGEAVDSTMRGFVYEAAGDAGAGVLAAGAEVAVGIARKNAIPIATIDATPAEQGRWLDAALAVVAALLAA